MIPITPVKAEDVKNFTALIIRNWGHDLLSVDELAVPDGTKYILQLRSVRPFLSSKYDLTKHPNCFLTADYDKKNTFDIEKYLNRQMKLKPKDEYVVVNGDAVAI